MFFCIFGVFLFFHLQGWSTFYKITFYVKLRTFWWFDVTMVFKSKNHLNCDRKIIKSLTNWQMMCCCSNFVDFHCFSHMFSVACFLAGIAPQIACWVLKIITYDFSVNSHVIWPNIYTTYHQFLYKCTCKTLEIIEEMKLL